MKKYISISQTESDKANEFIALIDKLKYVRKLKDLDDIIEEIDENEVVDMYRKRCDMIIRGVSKIPKVVCELCNCKVRKGGMWEHRQSKKCVRINAMNELKNVNRKNAKIDDNNDELINVKNVNKKKLLMKSKYIDLVIKMNKINKDKQEKIKDNKDNYNYVNNFVIIKKVIKKGNKKIIRKFIIKD